MEAKSNQNGIAEINSKKRVLFIVTQSELGGAQRFLCELISRLDRNKYEILAVAGKDGGGEFLEVLKNIGVSTRSLRFLKREISPYGDFRGYLEIKGLIGEFGPDTLFLNSSKAGVLGSLAARKFPHLKVIYRIGGWAFNDPWPWWKQLVYRWLEKISAPWKDYIIVNNKHDYDQAIKFGIGPKKKVVLIYNGIDPYKPEIFGKDEAKIKLFEKLPQKKRGFLHAKTVIGTIANFYKTKGLKYLIEAVKILNAEHKIRDVIFVIIGDGPEREKLESQIKESGVKDKIFLAGRLSDARRYLAAFDVFVLPSVKEGFPWALLEAMAAKLPVVTTNVGAVPEIIENGKNGFMVELRKPELIAQKIKELIGDEHLRQELGIQAHQTVVLKFDLNKMVEKVEALL